MPKKKIPTEAGPDMYVLVATDRGRDFVLAVGGKTVFSELRAGELAGELDDRFDGGVAPLLVLDAEAQ